MPGSAERPRTQPRLSLRNSAPATG